MNPRAARRRRNARSAPPLESYEVEVAREPTDVEFDDFARAERPTLVAFAWSLTGDRVVAEDLAQEALTIAWQRWDHVGGCDRRGRALPARQAHAVALRYVEDRSVAEIAEILGCALGTAKVHLHRGRLALARRLGLLEED